MSLCCHISLQVIWCVAVLVLYLFTPLVCAFVCAADSYRTQLVG